MCVYLYVRLEMYVCVCVCVLYGGQIEVAQVLFVLHGLLQLGRQIT